MSEREALFADGSYEAHIAAVAVAKKEWDDAKKAVADAQQREHEAFWGLRRARDEAYRAGHTGTASVGRLWT